MTGWLVPVVDTNPKRWPSARELSALGVPAKQVARWVEVRRRITRGLKKRVRKDVN